MEVIRPMATG